MKDWIELYDWLAPVLFVLGGIVCGIIFEWVVLAKVKRVTSRTHWKGDDVLVSSLRGMTFLWFSLAGIYAAIVSGTIRFAYLQILQKSLSIIFILTLTIVFARLVSGILRLYAQEQQPGFPAATIFTNFARAFVFILGLLMIFRSLGFDVTPVLTALGVGGLAVALALQDTLSNFFSGLQILGSKQVTPGDYVKLASGEEGYVIDITWRNTRIRALPNNMIIVPNSKLASEIMTNFHQPEKEMSVTMQIGVSYDSDLRKVEEVTIDVAKQVLQTVTGAASAFQPFIRYNKFDDFSINFTVILRAKEYVDQYLIKHEFVKALHERYGMEGIEIPFPIRTIYARQPFGIQPARES